MSLADIVRLFAVPVFGLIAYRDVKFRRVPDQVWYPLVGLGIVTLAFDAFQLQAAPTGLQREMILQMGIAIGFLLIIAFVLYVLGIVEVTFARTLAVIGLIYPLVPSDPLFGFDLPLVRPGHGLLSFTIISNAALIGLLYPVGYLLWNGLRGRFAPVMFAGRPIDRERVPDHPGRLLQTNLGFTFRGPDLEAIKAYLRWREVTVSLLAQRETALRTPIQQSAQNTATEIAGDVVSIEADDSWGAEQFLDEGEYVGDIRADELRSALDLLAAEEKVWVSANFPFAMPIFIGLIISVTVGDLATGILGLVS